MKSALYGFMHSLFLDQKSHSFEVLTRSMILICQQLMCTFHEVFYVCQQFFTLLRYLTPPPPAPP